MTGSTLPGAVARKQLANLMDGEADFVGLRLEKHNPDIHHGDCRLCTYWTDTGGRLLRLGLSADLSE